jgi:ATP-dependent RNA helicase RhlE
MSFSELRLIEPLLKSLRHEGYTTPTAIQSQAFPHVIAGRDLLGSAQTGTGKTAAFALPILQLLHGDAPEADGNGKHNGKPRNGKHERDPKRAIRALILSPTRELAAQIGDSFRAYGKHMDLRGTTIYGGVNQRPQCQALKDGVDIVVATPGRLMDLLNQGMLRLDTVEIFVLDEADRMLDMGFIHDIRRIISYLPTKRQTLMFSATMPKPIKALADTILTDPAVVAIAAKAATADTVKQSAYFVDPRSKADLLSKLLAGPDMKRTLVFSRTKHGADKITKRLNAQGYTAEAIHSNKSQNARIRALNNFKTGRARVLVASDIAARGIDVDEVTHVVNFDMPGDAETYVHRIGRSGRAGADGQAITFCAHDQKRDLKLIEKTIGRDIPVLQHDIPVPQQNEHAAARTRHPHPLSKPPPPQRKNKPGGPRKARNAHGPAGNAGHETGHTNSAAHANTGGQTRSASAKRRRNRAGKPRNSRKQTG